METKRVSGYRRKQVEFKRRKRGRRKEDLKKGRNRKDGKKDNEMDAVVVKT